MKRYSTRVSVRQVEEQHSETKHSVKRKRKKIVTILYISKSFFTFIFRASTISRLGPTPSNSSSWAANFYHLCLLFSALQTHIHTSPHIIGVQVKHLHMFWTIQTMYSVSQKQLSIQPSTVDHPEYLLSYVVLPWVFFT